MPETVSVKALYNAIQDLDPSGKYQHLTYNLSAHNTLAQNAWWVFIPFGSWGNPPTATPPAPSISPLENAILQAISDGFSDNSNQCFIDVTCLWDTEDFFADSNATTTIASALATIINNLPASVTPIIRFLTGSSDTTQNFMGMRVDSPRRYGRAQSPIRMLRQ